MFSILEEAIVYVIWYLVLVIKQLYMLSGIWYW